jgi:hypothetical protein
LHQQFDEPTLREAISSAFNGNFLRTPKHLHRLASQYDFKVCKPSSVDDCWAIYKECDLHIGSRLHAHLYFLSQAKKSYLVSVDGRAGGFAEALGFNLFDPISSDSLPDQDFPKYRIEAVNLFANMKKFVSATKKILEIDNNAI